ncbi:HD domain-containing phosphohydrolase [Dermatophilus congolensis]|uniref:HD domain-containing phosphohydrolase n=1 Tax=Dermatophilus congolensis TaxID=1863 RepID=UPI001AB04FD8|nr:HD domain-containing protein [Dermatophilus congolensis]
MSIRPHRLNQPGSFTDDTELWGSMHSSSQQPSSRVRAISLTAAVMNIILAAFLATQATLLHHHGTQLISSFEPFLGLLALGVLADGLRERSHDEEVELSFTAMILLGAIPLTGPVPATILGPLIMLLSPLASNLVRRMRGAGALPNRTALTFFVNASMMALVTSAAALTYALFGGTHIGTGPWTPTLLFTKIGIPLIFADLIFIVLNSILVAALIALESRQRLRHFVTGAMTVFAVLCLGYGITAFVFVVLWAPVGLGPLALVLILAPLMMSRWSYLEYVEERDIHHRLLQALAGAGELRSGTLDRPYRLARVCTATGSAMGLSGRDQDILREAATLHDVGILSIPWNTLDTRPEDLTDEQLDHIAGHTRISADIITDIDFLEDCAEAVLHHHERYDGRGYPSRLAGDEIPFASRIIAAADIAESLGTTLKATAEDRENLITGLRNHAGSTLDPIVVDALIRELRSSRGPDLLADLTNHPAASHHRHTSPQHSHQFAHRKHHGTKEATS